MKPELQCRINGHLNMVGIAITEISEDFAVFVWWRHGAVVRHNALVADVHEDLDGVLVVHRLVVKSASRSGVPGA